MMTEAQRGAALGPPGSSWSVEIALATGMVAAQVGCSMGTAVVLIQKRAQLIGCSSGAVVAAVLDRGFRFDREPRGHVRLVSDRCTSALDRSIEVAHAAGMVSTQAACSCDEAVSRLEQRAAVDGCTVDDIARAVINRRICFDRPQEQA